MSIDWQKQAVFGIHPRWHGARSPVYNGSMRAGSFAFAVADPASASAFRLADHDREPREDGIVLLDAAWSDYERLLRRRGERAVPRMAYLDGVLELVSPSEPHESLKSRIGQLVEAWCLEHDVEFSAYRAWTIEDQRRKAAAEADECYVFGVGRRPRRPHLAIEVVWTSGGLDKNEIYRRLRVREVWFWQRGRLSVHALRGSRYEELSSSEVLPGIDLAALVTFLDRPTDSQCIRAYRAHLERRRKKPAHRTRRVTRRH